MRRLNTILTVVLLGLTVPLGRLVYKDVLRLRAEERHAQAFNALTGFTGLTLEGEPYDLEDGPRTELVGLFVFHRDRLEEDLLTWNAIHDALGPGGVAVVGICDHADCAAHVRRAQVAPRFTLLAATGFQHAHSLAMLDARHSWMIFERSGRPLGVFDVPQDARAVPAAIQEMLRSLKEGPHESPSPPS